MFLKIFNLENEKIFSKFLIKIKKNIKIYILKKGCYKNKYFFFYTKIIKKKNIIINKKNKNIIFNLKNFIFNLNNIKIKFKKFLKIKNKNINKLCKCKFSFI